MGGMLDFSDISLMLATHPSVIFFLIIATPLPLKSFSAASASAFLTVLILAASPSYSAAVLRLIAALISFIERMTSSGGFIDLICTLSKLYPPYFILGPASLRILSARCDCSSKSSSRVFSLAAFLTMLSVYESSCLRGSSISKRALAESSCLMRYCMEMSNLGKTLSWVLTFMLEECTQSLLLTLNVSSIKGIQNLMPGPLTRFNLPNRVTTNDSLV